DWSGLDVFFSDERCVPPDDPASNYGMAKRTLLGAVGPRRVHRMRGETDPHEAAAMYDEVVVDPFELVVLGLGDDAHVAGLFPRSPGLLEAASCTVVDRPDGMQGLSLTPPALLSGKQIVFVVAGGSKADAVRRAVAADEDVMDCPAAMFRDHGSVTFLLDEAAAAR
ncbi:MAG TPA: 6-phosphogluconolactonase, partial [Actinomycetota bacterium]|nr:6-phosphogluconolactonase [Actinomycetota bacterium]